MPYGSAEPAPEDDGLLEGMEFPWHPMDTAGENAMFPELTREQVAAAWPEEFAKVKAEVTRLRVTWEQAGWPARREIGFRTGCRY